MDVARRSRLQVMQERETLLCYRIARHHVAKGRDVWLAVLA